MCSKLSWKDSYIFFSVAVSSAKRMLQELDANTVSREKNAELKIAERDKVIAGHKVEVERLEKKAKTLEYKVCVLDVAFRRARICLRRTLVL